MIAKPDARLRERSRRHPDVVGLGLLVSRDAPRVERPRDRAVRTGRARYSQAGDRLLDLLLDLGGGGDEVGATLDQQEKRLVRVGHRMRE